MGMHRCCFSSSPHPMVMKACGGCEQEGGCCGGGRGVAVAALEHMSVCRAGGDDANVARPADEPYRCCGGTGQDILLKSESLCETPLNGKAHGCFITDTFVQLACR